MTRAFVSGHSSRILLGAEGVCMFAARLTGSLSEFVGTSNNLVDLYLGE